MKRELSYEEWLETVSERTTDWSMWRLEVYRRAHYLTELAFLDAERLRAALPGFERGDLAIHATRISAKIAFGHGRWSRANALPGYNAALESAWRVRAWYESCAPHLGEECARRRLQLLDMIMNHLLLLTRVADDPEQDDELWDDSGAWEEGE